MQVTFMLAPGRGGRTGYVRGGGRASRQRTEDQREQRSREGRQPYTNVASIKSYFKYSTISFRMEGIHKSTGDLL